LTTLHVWVDDSLVSETRAADREAILDEVVAHLSTVVDRRRRAMPDWASQELTFGQLRLLMYLFHHGPIAMRGVGGWLGVSAASTTGTVARLERHGLVQRCHQEADRRVVECALTDRGRDLVHAVSGDRIASLRTALSVLEPAELVELDHLLQLVLARSPEPDAGIAGPAGNGLDETRRRRWATRRAHAIARARVDGAARP
jgi:DNA-binding MarR family transcriptional regulator